jgi:hypothetical protein
MGKLRLPRGYRGLKLGGYRLRVRTWSRWLYIDQELARGIDPCTSDEHALRAGQLRSSRHRSQMAKAIIDVTDRAHTHSSPRSAAVPLRKSDVRRVETDLLELAYLLLRDEAPPIEALATTSTLLYDALGSPLYNARGPHSLDETVRSALRAFSSRAAH